jgi:DNA/RNA endonuclease G (NUC1)
MIHRITALALALLAHGASLASPSCPQHYADGRSPEIRNEKLARATQELCYQSFGLMHSGLTRTPLWSAEYLTPGHLEAAQNLSRENSFHPEPQLPPSQRAELADYARSGFDRGHMAPSLGRHRAGSAQAGAARGWLVCDYRPGLHRPRVAQDWQCIGAEPFVQSGVQSPPERCRSLFCRQ